MYTAIKGIYENGKIKFSEEATTLERSEVLIMFLKEKDNENNVSGKGRTPGSLKKWGEKSGKKFSIPDSFNEPIEDLKDYM